MLSIVLLVGIAIVLSSTFVRRALPFESLLAFGLTGLVMLGLLFSGNIG